MELGPKRTGQEGNVSDKFKLHYYDISYFSGKMQAYLAYKGIPHELNEARWLDLAWRVVEQTGVIEVPVIERPDGTFMRDTTSMIEWFEERYPRGPVLSTDSAALTFLLRLIEDYADEGLWRPALYYRWAFDKDARLYARRFTDEFLNLPIPAPLLRAYVILRQRHVYLREEGVTKANAGRVEQHYFDELADLQALLETQPFVTGHRPSLADFGYFASMFRHFAIDPTPARIMREQAPAVCAWIGRMWNARHASYADAALIRWPSEPLPEPLLRILQRAGRLYFPYMLRNHRAVADGEDRFDVELDGATYPNLPAIPFRAWSRHRLIELYREIRARGPRGGGRGAREHRHRRQPARRTGSRARVPPRADAPGRSSASGRAAREAEDQPRRHPPPHRGRSTTRPRQPLAWFAHATSAETHEVRVSRMARLTVLALGSPPKRPCRPAAVSSTAGSSPSET